MKVIVIFGFVFQHTLLLGRLDNGLSFICIGLACFRVNYCYNGGRTDFYGSAFEQMRGMGQGGTADGAGHVFQPAETIRPDEADITFVAAAGPFSGIIWRCVGIDIGQ